MLVLEKQKFTDMKMTAKGEPRAFVHFDRLNTLWFNSGTLCNLQCKNCYIKSSPRNDSLSFLNVDDIQYYLEEIKNNDYPTKLIGITGGEPFMNPHIIDILKLILKEGFEVLILTNAYKVIRKYQESLLELNRQYSKLLHLRVSLDHYTLKKHEEERGKGTFKEVLKWLSWLYESSFNISIAGRSLVNEQEEKVFEGYKNLLESYGIIFSGNLVDKIVIFPEMNSGDVPEITTACWDILKVSPSDQMCANERMVIKRKGRETSVVPCTIITDDESFEFGKSLKEAEEKVYLNHPFCASFCILGGSSCSKIK